MIKRILTIILLVFTVFVGVSQTKATISGIVIDSLSKKPIEYCNLSFKNITDTTQKNLDCITNNEGRYKIDIPLGYNYLVQISRVGYKTIIDTAKFIFEDIENSKDVDYSDIPAEFLQNFEQDTIELVPQKELLQTVTVKGKTKTMDIDKQSFIVTKKMRENTIAAKDVLDKLEGVSYNRVTQDIKVDNDKKVKILVDGVKKDRDYILNLNPKRIKKIEILRNISGLYATEGYTSVINLITYDNYRGYDFTTNEQFISNIHSKKHSYLTQNDANVAVNITRDQWNYYLKVSNNYNHTGLKTRNITRFITDDETIINGNNQTPNTFDKYSNYSLTLGSDYKINKKQVLGAEIELEGFPAISDAKTVSYDTITINGVSAIMQNTTLSHSVYHDFSGNLYYKYEMDSTAKVVTYLYLKNNQSEHLQNINKEKELHYRQYSDNINYKLEYTKTFKDKYTLTTGGRYLSNRFKSLAQDSTQNDFQNSLSKLTAYTYLKVRFNTNTGLLFGSSYELYQSENKDIHTTFHSFQPRIHFYKTINQNHKFVLEYSLKTKYPYLSDMNPQLTYITPFVANMGNPELRPFLYHNFSLEFRKMGNKLLSYFSIKPYYQFSDNEMGLNPEMHDSLIIYQNQNFVKHEKYGVATALSFEYKEKFSLDLDFDLYRDWNKNLTTPNIVDWAGAAQITYTLNTKHYFGLMYQKEHARTVSSLGYSYDDMDFVMLYWMTLQLKGRLQLMIGYGLPVLPTQMNEDYEATPYYIKHDYTEMSISENMIMIDLVFRLSKGKVSKLKKNIDYEDYEKGENNNLNIGL